MRFREPSRPWTPTCGDPSCDGTCLTLDCVPPAAEPPARTGLFDVVFSWGVAGAFLAMDIRSMTAIFGAAAACVTWFYLFPSKEATHYELPGPREEAPRRPPPLPATPPYLDPNKERPPFNIASAFRDENYREHWVVSYRDMKCKVWCRACSNKLAEITDVAAQLLDVEGMASDNYQIHEPYCLGKVQKRT